MNSSEWFAIQVWSGRERASADHLLSRGYEAFLPCYRERRRWSDRYKTFEAALFPGYVFCRVNPSVYGKIVTTPGVIRIVGAVDLNEVQAIERTLAAGLAVEPCEYVRVGNRVRIEVGPLQGVEGIVLRIKNRHRLILSITALQRSVAVEVESEWVNVVNSTSYHPATAAPLSK